MDSALDSTNRPSNIPWDTDEPSRPDWLPYPNEAIDAATAGLIAARYTAEVQRMLSEIEAAVAVKSKGERWVHAWTAAEIVRDWGTGALGGILVGHVTVDQRAIGGNFHNVIVSVDKESGALMGKDHHGLLT